MVTPSEVSKRTGSSVTPAGAVSCVGLSSAAVGCGVAGGLLPSPDVASSESPLPPQATSNVARSNAIARRIFRNLRSIPRRRRNANPRTRSGPRGVDILSDDLDDRTRAVRGDNAASAAVGDGNPAAIRGVNEAEEVSAGVEENVLRPIADIEDDEPFVRRTDAKDHKDACAVGRPGLKRAVGAIEAAILNAPELVARVALEDDCELVGCIESVLVDGDVSAVRARGASGVTEGEPML